MEQLFLNQLKKLYELTNDDDLYNLILKYYNLNKNNKSKEELDDYHKNLIKIFKIYIIPKFITYSANNKIILDLINKVKSDKNNLLNLQNDYQNLVNELFSMIFKENKIQHSILVELDKLQYLMIDNLNSINDNLKYQELVNDLKIKITSFFNYFRLLKDSNIHAYNCLKPFVNKLKFKYQKIIYDNSLSLRDMYLKLTDLETFQENILIELNSDEFGQISVFINNFNDIKELSELVDADYESIIKDISNFKLGNIVEFNELIAFQERIISQLKNKYNQKISTYLKSFRFQDIDLNKFSSLLDNDKFIDKTTYELFDCILNMYGWILNSAQIREKNFFTFGSFDCLPNQHDQFLDFYNVDYENLYIKKRIGSLIEVIDNDKCTYETRQNKKLLDYNGNVVLSGFSEIMNFSDGMAVIVIEEDGKEKYGYINNKFEIVIPCKYDGASSFKNGLAIVYNKIETTFEYYDEVHNIFRQQPDYYCKHFIIDKSGNIINSEEFGDACRTSDDWFIVRCKKSNRCFVHKLYNKNGCSLILQDESWPYSIFNNWIIGKDFNYCSFYNFAGEKIKGNFLGISVLNDSIAFAYNYDDIYFFDKDLNENKNLYNAIIKDFFGITDIKKSLDVVGRRYFGERLSKLKLCHGIVLINLNLYNQADMMLVSEDGYLNKDYGRNLIKSIKGIAPIYNQLSELINKYLDSIKSNRILLKELYDEIIPISKNIIKIRFRNFILFSDLDGKILKYVKNDECMLYNKYVIICKIVGNKKIIKFYDLNLNLVKTLKYSSDVSLSIEGDCLVLYASDGNKIIFDEEFNVVNRRITTELPLSVIYSTLTDQKENKLKK